MLSDEWRTIAEFPNWEINLHGEIREKGTLRPRETHSGNYVESVKFTKDGQRYMRSVRKLVRIAFSV